MIKWNKRAQLTVIYIKIMRIDQLLLILATQQPHGLMSQPPLKLITTGSLECESLRARGEHDEKFKFSRTCPLHPPQGATDDYSGDCCRGDVHGDRSYAGACFNELKRLSGGLNLAFDFTQFVSIVVLGTTSTKRSNRETLILALAAAYLPNANATEWALSDSSTVINDDPDLRTDWTPDPSYLTLQAFNFFYHAEGGAWPYTKDIKLDLGSSVTVTMANVVNYLLVGHGNADTSMGNSAFYITDNPGAINVSDYTKCSGDFHDGGFITLTNCKGRYLNLRREGSGMVDARLNMSQIRVYTVTNLLEGAAVIEAPTPKAV